MLAVLAGWTGSRLAALLSTAAAFAIVVATFFAWFDTSWGGGHVMRRWVRYFLAVVALVLLASAILLIVSDE
jgi:hypothetical protein